MSERDKFRAIQTVLGVEATGIPNDATKTAFQTRWDAALAEYRAGTAQPSIPSTASDSMGITNDWLDKASRQPLPGGSDFRPECLVIHFTAGASGQSSIDYWRNLNNGVCAHLVIERDGAIIQCRPFTRTCGHAGVSRWVNPKTGVKRSGLNQYAIGIEIANAGDSAEEIRWVRERAGYEGVKLKHRNGGPLTTWEVYPAAQIAAVTAVSRALVATYGLADVTGHDCIAPERKNDPGPAFNMQLLREACGFSGLPSVHRA